MHLNPSISKFIKFLPVIVFTATFPNLIVFAQQKQLVESVDIQGNRQNRDEILLKAIKTRPGDAFDEKQVQADLQSLLKMNLFDPRGTKVFRDSGSRDGVNVIFEVYELPIISELTIEGISGADKTQIFEIFKKLLDLEAGKPFMPYKLRVAKKIIEKYLAEKSYSVTRISITEEEVSAIRVKIGFEIEAKREPQFIKISL